MKKRSSGILLHITSLPSPYGIGDMGPAAYAFADFLADTCQGFWQVLPLNPTYPYSGNSPYKSPSSIAGNTLLISPELMAQQGLINQKDLFASPVFLEDKIDYKQATAYKIKLFNQAFERFQHQKNRYDFERFCLKQKDWLEDFALFTAIVEYFHGETWQKWPKEVRDRDIKALQSLREKLKKNIEKEKFLQFVFFNQWFFLKNYCNQKNIKIFGDMPIYVNYQSADTWANPDIFKLNQEKYPRFVAGVPPDCFSRTGQLWGDPVYDWETLKQKKYGWWIERMKHCLNVFDVVRIDHFRGFAGYWEIPYGEKTAINGRWEKGPGKDFFNAMLKQLPNLQVIAEDLGLITPDVQELIHYFRFPGMKVLLFAFDETLPQNPYAPHNHIKNCVTYTGTHDNNTVRGWFENEAGQEDKQRFFQYLGHEVGPEDAHLCMIRLAMMSVANLAIIPLQDILGLGEEARMNTPATANGNWLWRFKQDQISSHVKGLLKQMTILYGRE